MWGCDSLLSGHGSLKSLDASKGVSKIFFCKHDGFKIHFFFPLEDAVLYFLDQNDSLGTIYIMHVFPFKLWKHAFNY